MSEALQLLLVEDNPNDEAILLRELRKAGFDPTWRRVETESDFRAALHAGLDLVLSDYHLPSFDGLRALQIVRELGLDLPFIIVSGTIGEDTAVEAMRNGAFDYLIKDRLAR